MTTRHRQLIENTRRLGLNLDAIIAGVECMEIEEKADCFMVLNAMRNAKDFIRIGNELLRSTQQTK